MSLSLRKWLIFAWLLILVAAGAEFLLGFRVDSNLSAFMPAAKTDAQALLLDEIESGPASRIWLLAVGTTNPEDLEEISRRLADGLRATGGFRRVYAGQAGLDEAVRQILFTHRYLLDPDGGAAQYTTDALRQAFEEGLGILGSPVSPFQKQLVTRDPTGAFLRVLNTLQPAGMEIRRRDDTWVSSDGTTAFLMAEANADGTDLNAQEQIGASLTALFDALSRDFELDFRVSGPPSFAVAAKQRIQLEAQVFSFASAALLIAILWSVYGSISRVLLISVPLAGSLLIAVAVTSAIWGSVHGISLALGATLLGVALDYPIHLVTHAQPGESLYSSVPRVWPTLRLGVLTTVLGFSAMLTTDFPGIRQLAVFSISGLIGAAFLTRYLLPSLVAAPVAKPPRLLGLADRIGRLPARSWLIVPILLVAVIVKLWGDPAALFASRIDSLSPVPATLVAQDREIRTAMGLAEPGYMLLVRGETTDKLLQRQESLRAMLHQAIARGYVKDFDMAANILPSKSTQIARRDALPDTDTLRERVSLAQTGLPFRADAFQTFQEDVAAARGLGVLGRQALSGSLLEARLESLIRSTDSGFNGMVQLIGLSDKLAFTRLIDSMRSEAVVFIDIQSATSDLINTYRDEILVRSLFALLIVTGILAVALRDRQRLFRVMLPVLGAVAAAGATPVLLGQALNIFHLASLLLVAGIGLDYALFFSRPSGDPTEVLSNGHSLLVCALSTVSVFLMLSLSSIAVLNSIGLTVAVGAASAFILSATLSASSPHAKA